MPNPSLLEIGEFPALKLAEFAIREGRRPRPIYTAHKWFARRLGCVFRALLIGGASDPETDFWDAYYGTADLQGVTVLDPFVGGGTSVVEASRLGAAVIGIDIDPVACAVTRFELEANTLPDLRSALRLLQESVGARIRPLHVSIDEAGRERVVLHHFWVQTIECGACAQPFQAHPTYLLAEDKESQWVVCSHCGEIARRPAGQERFMCYSCRRFTVVQAGTVNYGTATCPACGHRQALIEVGRAAESPPTWELFALELLDAPDGGRPLPMTRRRFVRARDADKERYEEATLLCTDRRRSHPHFFPLDPIADGDRFDSRLLDYGYRRWTDLFNDRQIFHLSLLAEGIAEFDEPVRRALAVAFSDHLTTNCMMTAYAASWRRLTPLFSIRAFRHVPRPVELNPWCDGTGRGTYPNTVRKLMRASDFARAPKEPVKKGGFKSVPLRRSASAPNIVCATAQDLAFVADGAVDMVLTDPPYFDNIAYSELAEFFLPWMQLVGLVSENDGRERIVLGSLIARRNDAEATTRFTAGLSDAFAEVARVLKADGLLVFSFRHAVPDAWYALTIALARAAFRATHILPAPGEAGVGLHAHEGTGLWDAVFVLRKGRARNDADLRVGPTGEAHVETLVAGWTRKLKRARLPFTDTDRLALRRAGLAAVALGLVGDVPDHDGSLLQDALNASAR
ncbi:MAG: DNA methyltransferase [Planctomycetota bacterium]|nr:DNA methyltransferase [Planctomycetota bacterium]